MLDLLFLWLAIGAALFCAELLHTTRLEWASLRRLLMGKVADMHPALGALAVSAALLFVLLATLIVWCATWPMRLGWLFRGRR